MVNSISGQSFPLTKVQPPCLATEKPADMQGLLGLRHGRFSLGPSTRSELGRARVSTVPILGLWDQHRAAPCTAAGPGEGASALPRACARPR